MCPTVVVHDLKGNALLKGFEANATFSCMEWWQAQFATAAQYCCRLAVLIGPKVLPAGLTLYLEGGRLKKCLEQR
jgi:hypothetical protein